MIRNILEKIEGQTVTISQWMTGFAGIFFIRFILEALSSPTRSGIIASDPYTVIHYALFWTTLVLGIILIVGFFTRDYVRAAKAALFGLPAIWSAPIIDIVISHGKGLTQSYLFDNGAKLIADFFTFFGRTASWGATYGVRAEMALVLVGIGWYVWQKNKSVARTIAGIICSYVFGFIIFSWPGILYTLTHIHGVTASLTEIYNYLATIIFHSNIAHNTLHEGINSVSTARFLEIGFDKFASQMLFIVSCALGGMLFWKLESEKFKAVIKNSRPERIASYLALLLSGAGFAYINGLGNTFTPADTLGLACLLVSWFALWMHAVHINDIVDVDIDKISNPNRPLIKKELSEKDMRETGHVWLLVALLGSWCAGFYPFFMSLIYIAAYYIYSAPPLRLRRFPGVSSFLIGIAGLATILSGFFFISANKQLQTFPMLLAAGIIVMITLAINVKDMKDIAGDKANGIITLPILFGKNGPQVVGLCFALSFLLLPIFLSFYSLYIIAVPIAIAGYRLVMRNPYHEEPIFVLRFLFLGCVGLLYISAHYLALSYHI